MGRNAESRFAINPTNIQMPRSRFDRNSSVKLSFNVGDIIPFYVDEVLPGDTFNISTSKVVRMQPMVAPIMDNIYLDTYYFFVPNRLVWEHWKEFNGENTQNAWFPQTEYQVPQLVSPAEGGWSVGTIADYMGIPTGVPNLSVNALPFRAYGLIMNDWFRDENLSDPINVPLDDATVNGVNTGTFITDVCKGGLPYTASKYHDYFTSCLPAPQKGPDVTIPVSTGTSMPVVTGDAHINSSYPAMGIVPAYLSGNAKSFYPTVDRNGVSGTWNSRDSVSISSVPDSVKTSSFNPESGASWNQIGYVPSNLWAVNDGKVSSATINQLRLAFQIQKMYEKDARGGTRYIELLKAHFGVTSPDARLQRPEYLGGNRVPININQVIQQSATQSGSTPQGTPTGLSLTTDRDGSFTKSFVEHGFVIGLMVARYSHTYQQGLERFWSRKSRFDYYWPVFANIGEQAVLNKEIYAQGANVKVGESVVDEEVFGYQEAWADYRYKPSRVSGEMRSKYSQSLDIWHLADDYSSLPSLSDAWIREDKNIIDRVMAVGSSVSNQLFADIYIQNRTTRPMPTYSIPGLIDHF